MLGFSRRTSGFQDPSHVNVSIILRE